MQCVIGADLRLRSCWRGAGGHTLGDAPGGETTVVILSLVLTTLSLEPSVLVVNVVPKPHARDAATHVGDVPVLLRRTFAGPKETKAASDFTRVVYGYYPYWTSTTDPLPWEHLTHLSYFSVDLNADGSLGNNHGWAGSGRDLVAAGHGYGVKVTLTATLFDNASIAALLASPTKRSAAVENLLALVQTEGGDGVSIDFETVPVSAKDDFVTFMSLLTSVFHFQIPGSHVSLASPAIDSAGSYDYDKLATACDGLMIMGYDYYWSGGDPGPTSPISVGTTWTGRDLRWTTSDYLQHGGADNRDRFMLGLPLYGRDWPSTSSHVPGTKTANGTAKLLKDCDVSFADGKVWDADSETPYKVYQQASEWRQLFCEDTQSLATKFDLVQEVDFGGVMFWAIGYAPTDHPVWQELDARFKRQAPNQAPVAVIAETDVTHVGAEVTLDGSASFDPDGDRLTYAWTVVEGPAIDILESDRSLAHVTPAEPAAYRFALTVSDGLSDGTTEAVLQVISPNEPPLEEPPSKGCSRCAGASGSGWAGLVVLLCLVHRRWRSQ